MIEKMMRERELGVFWHLVLFPLSVVYEFAVRLRTLLYGAGVLHSAKLLCGVVSVGNITVGGTGKTPLTILIAEFLRRKDKRVVILSRGYKRKGTGVALVSDLNGVLLGPDDAGDEPYLMAKRLPGVPVVVGADRVAGGRFAAERFKPDFIILDDGFQHLRLKRDLNILLVDGEEGFGNGYILPRGILREPRSKIDRADVVFVKGAKLRDPDGDWLKKFFIPALHFSYRPSLAYDLNTGARKPIEFFKGKTALAVAGLANPQSFFKTLGELEVTTSKRLIFPDHHSYSAGDLELIKREAQVAGLIITTEKDGVKLKGTLPGLPVYCLSIDAVFEDRDRRDFEKLFAPLLKGGL
ncbi:MAG: tetraacyldisaccharide 4'-kinase [Deltaproteobacteria bacterium]|nr:tetraacyldisaccharide 4'-kinase [Deltaproteobacteria bacterium]